MELVDVLSGALLGAGAASLARAAWQATAGAPREFDGRQARAAEWGAIGLVLVGSGMYVREAFGGSPPAHPLGISPGAPWWQIAAVAGGVLATAATGVLAHFTIRMLRAVRRRRRRELSGSAHLAALHARHDVVREQYGTVLLADPYRLDPISEHADRVTAALHQAADLRDEAATSYAACSQYARTLGELEAIWGPLAEAARVGGVLPADDE